MKCPHCQSEWKVSSGLSVTVRECPFCGQSLAPQPGECDTMEAVLRSIRDAYGMDTLKSGKILLGYFKDLAPKMKKERKMLAEFVDAGGPAALFAAVTKPEGEQRIAVEKMVLCLTEDHLMAENFAKTVCTTFFAVIGGKHTPLQTETSAAQPPKQQAPSSDFEITPDGILKAYHGNEIRIVIPEGVKQIGEDAFVNRYIVEIVFPAGLTHIHKNAFSGCGLSTDELVLPHGLAYIGDYAFQMGNFKSVQLPDTLTHIGAHAFEACSNLKEVTIPGSVKTVPDAAFFMCDKLERVTFESGVAAVEATAFALCGSLKWIMVPASLTDVHPGAFVNPLSKEKAQVVLTEPWKDIDRKRFKNVANITL